jgi:hypothetical protein
MSKIIILLGLIFTPLGFAKAPVPYLVSLGAVTITDKANSWEYQLSYCPGLGSECRAFNEVVIARMEAPALPASTPATCTQTVRALFDGGQVGEQSVTYGRRLQVNGAKLTLKALETCGQKMKFNVTGILYL